MGIGRRGEHSEAMSGLGSEGVELEKEGERKEGGRDSSQWVIGAVFVWLLEKLPDRRG